MLNSSLSSGISWINNFNVFCSFSVAPSVNNLKMFGVMTTVSIILPSGVRTLFSSIEIVLSLSLNPTDGTEAEIGPEPELFGWF
ncbi:hypothetical protein D3C73_585640 [compost metagenome]